MLLFQELADKRAKIPVQRAQRELRREAREARETMSPTKGTRRGASVSEYCSRTSKANSGRADAKCSEREMSWRENVEKWTPTRRMKMSEATGLRAGEKETDAARGEGGPKRTIR